MKSILDIRVFKNETKKKTERVKATEQEERIKGEIAREVVRVEDLDDAQRLGARLETTSNEEAE